MTDFLTGESSVNRYRETTSGTKRKRESPQLEDQPAKKRKGNANVKLF